MRLPGGWGSVVRLRIDKLFPPWSLCAPLKCFCTQGPRYLFKECFPLPPRFFSSFLFLTDDEPERLEHGLDRGSSEPGSHREVLVQLSLASSHTKAPSLLSGRKSSAQVARLRTGGFCRARSGSCRGTSEKYLQRVSAKADQRLTPRITRGKKCNAVVVSAVGSF